MEKCTWWYRAGTNDTHFAIATCDKKAKYLSKIPKSTQHIRVADFYNDRICPVCGKIIEMKYDLLEDS